MPDSVLEAISLGLADFEPREIDSHEFEACEGMPGTQAKLTALAERARLGLPLWHPLDRQDCEEEPLETRTSMPVGKRPKHSAQLAARVSQGSV